MAKRFNPYNPDAEFNAPKLTAEEGLELCERILEKIDEIDADVWERGGDFFQSVKDKVTDINATIERSCRFTEGQKRALENMEGGIDRWLEH